MESSLASLANILNQALKLHSTFPALCWLVLNWLAFMPYVKRHLAGSGLEAVGPALVVLLALFIGYTLDSLNFILLSLLESESVPATWWGELMVAWQRGHKQSLDQDVIQPTALGTRTAIGKARIWSRYEIDAVYMNPHLMVVLNKNGYATQVEREKANLDFFLNLCVLSLLFVIECVAARMLGWHGLALIPWAAVGGAYGFYRLAIPCAEKWYDWINAAYDLYRYQLAEQLALRPFTDKVDETRRWRAISRFIKHGRKEEFWDFSYPVPGENKAQTEIKIARR